MYNIKYLIILKQQCKTYKINKLAGKIIYHRITNTNYFLIRVELYAVIKKTMLRLNRLIE